MDRRTSENIVNLAQIIRTQVHLDSTDILLEALEPRRPGNRHDPGFLSQEPRQRKLGGRDAFPCGEGNDGGSKPLVGLARLSLEPRKGTADVAFPKHR